MPNDKEKYKAEGRKDCFLIPEEHLTIVEDPTSPLYDERIKLPVDVALVKSIKANGIKVPCVVWRDGEKIYIVDGRQRLRAVRKANEELLAEGGEPHFVPCMPQRASDAGKLADLVVMLNEIRRQDDHITRAKKMQRLIDLGRDNEQVALAFGVSESTVRNMLTLLELAAPVQQAVKTGALAMTVALDMNELSREDQLTKLEELKQNPAVKGEAARRVVRGEGTVQDTVGKLTKRDFWLLLQAVENVRDAHDSVTNAEVADLKRKLKSKAADYAPPVEGEEKPKRRRVRA